MLYERYLASTTILKTYGNAQKGAGVVGSTSDLC